MFVICFSFYFSIEELARIQVEGYAFVICVFFLFFQTKLQWFFVISIFQVEGFVLQIRVQLKGTQGWEFFGLRYWNLYFSVVSNAEMLRFRLKKNFVGPLLGEIWLFCVYWDYAVWKKILSQVKFFAIFQVSNVPFIFANNSFSNIWSIKSYSDGFISKKC